VLVALPTAALSQLFYKWIGDDGKAQYSDRPPPKGFTGPVTRIEVDPSPPPTEIAAPQNSNGLAPDKVKPPPAADVGAKRRELRLKLAARLALAREKYEAAKAALADGDKPQDDERQIVQQRFEKAQAGRSNCRAEKGANGKTIALCAGAVPSEAYYDRVKQLEEAVKQAESEVVAAEQAYRRGVD
jgi:hypothetical protein